MPHTKSRSRVVTKELRGAPRYAANPDSFCRVFTTEESTPERAEIQNIASTGIRVVMDQMHEPGTPLLVELTGKQGALQRQLMVRVAQAHSREDGRFSLGCKFMTPLDGHELLTLVL